MSDKPNAKITEEIKVEAGRLWSKYAEAGRDFDLMLINTEEDQSVEAAILGRKACEEIAQFLANFARDVEAKARLDGAQRLSTILEGTSFDFHVQKQIHVYLAELQRDAEGSSDAETQTK